LKKIDLHIHTIPTISDSGFTFSLDTFKRYADEARLDAVAITNHDVFDGVQFRQIYQSLDAIVFPGITNLTGHPGLEPGSCIGATCSA
jgi:predicted metal-dependent phosphoesterase TrpH